MCNESEGRISLLLRRIPTLATPLMGFYTSNLTAPLDSTNRCQNRLGYNKAKSGEGRGLSLCPGEGNRIYNSTGQSWPSMAILD